MLVVETILKIRRLSHVQDRYQHSAGCSASTRIFPVRHVMMPNTRYFQKCHGRPERSLSARYHPSIRAEWAATAVHAADIPAKMPAGKAMNVNPPGPD